MEQTETPRIRAYSSPFNLGHKALEALWEGTVHVQEKIDGSQISFGIFEGQLLMRSHGADISLEKPGMFKLAVEAVQARLSLLVPGHTYRGEFLSKPKHNTLEYANVPEGYIVLFDVDDGDQYYYTPADVRLIAADLHFTPIPTLVTFDGNPGLDVLKTFLEFDSCLGGTKVEGIVLKNYSQYGPDKKILIGKLVRSDFVEAHKTDWKGRNPSGKDFVALVASDYATPARWRKALQHLREEGRLEQTPRDIPMLIDAVVEDIEKDCAEEIRDRLFKHFWQPIKRGSIRGLAEWYKRVLAGEPDG